MNVPPKEFCHASCGKVVLSNVPLAEHVRCLPGFEFVAVATSRNFVKRLFKLIRAHLHFN